MSLDKTAVTLDPERVWEFTRDTQYVTDNYNSKSRLSGLAQASSLTVAQLEGRHTIPRWKVESLAVLLRCLPSALLKETIAPTVAPKKEEAVTITDHRQRPMQCAYCGKACTGGQGKSAHERHCTENPANSQKPKTGKVLGTVPVTVRGSVDVTPVYTRPPLTVEQMEALPDDGGEHITGVDMATGLDSTAVLALELIDTKMELIRDRLTYNPLGETERIIADLDRIRELVKQVTS